MALEGWFHVWPRICLCVIVLVSGTTANTQPPGNGNNGTTTVHPLLITSASKTGGLESADVAAIVLGCLLVCLIVLGVVVCVLYNKGRVENVPNEKRRHVIPGVPAFSTTSNSIRRLSMDAINKSRQQKYRPPDNDTKQPIVYMFNDVYHPPNTRPLPWNDVPAERYEERVKPVTMPKQQLYKQKKVSLKSTGKQRRPPHPSTRRPRRPQVPPDGFHVSYPGDAMINFTFHGSSAPYNDWKKPYNTP